MAFLWQNFKSSFTTHGGAGPIPPTEVIYITLNKSPQGNLRRVSVPKGTLLQVRSTVR